jgi:hypothetical protein
MTQMILGKEKCKTPSFKKPFICVNDHMRVKDNNVLLYYSTNVLN